MEAKRLFRDSDSDMLAQIMGSLQSFKKHLSDFTAYDPLFNLSYYNAWKDALDNLTPYYKQDENNVFVENLLLNDADAVLARCRLKYRDVKYFAGKAFPDNKEALKEFGEVNYNKVRGSRLRMVQFMETLHGVATKYKVQLIAQNYTQTAIDEIATLATELRNANQTQQLKKQERPTETRKRIEALNLFYSYGQKVWEAAQEVFRDNEIYRNQFMLSPRHHPKVIKSWFTLGPGGIRKTEIKKLLKKYPVTLTNQSPETVQYWQANSISQTPAQKQTLHAGEVISIEAEEPPLKFLIVQNTSGKAVRMMVERPPLNPLCNLHHYNRLVMR